MKTVRKMRIRRHLPNAITCCNLISGCIAVTFALSGELRMAFLMIILGAVFDFFDGLVARLLGVSSPIGKELDSLADVVTFGVAPSALIFQVLQGFALPDEMMAIQPFVPYLSFLIAAFSALRLAKFNLDERQLTSFIGLPTPANALFWGAFVVAQDTGALHSALGQTIILVGILVSCWLLVSEVPLFALKFKTWGWKGNEIRYVFLFLAVLNILLLGIGGIASIVILYIFLSLLPKRKSEEK